MDKGKVEIARDKGEFISTGSHLRRRRTAPSSISCIEALSFLFSLRRAARSWRAQRESICWKRFSVNFATKIARHGTAHHLPPTSSFPPLFRARSSLLFFCLIERRIFRVSIWRAPRKSFPVRLILWQNVCYRDGETARFPIRSCATAPAANRRFQFRNEMREWIATRISCI